ncbi:hypothetical protein D920_02189 [Enterococcus faecalis 13-SD-W-01]|nr:hypothetical protein D920_02189 [Enterococcus faecalis 13-SD-W-01]
MKKVPIFSPQPVSGRLFSFFIEAVESPAMCIVRIRSSPLRGCEKAVQSQALKRNPIK